MQHEYINKHNTLRGLIKHKDISAILREAIDSPIGSTSRKRAKSIISVLNKANLDGAGGPGYFQSYDGAGGPGYSQQTQTPKDYSRLVVFKQAPKMSPVMDGAGGPGDQGYVPGVVQKTFGSGNVGDPGYQPGVIEKGVTGASNWVAESAIPGVEKAGLGAVAGAMGTGEFLAKRFGRGLGVLGNTLFGYNANDPSAAINTPVPQFKDTFGGQALSGLFPGSQQAPQAGTQQGTQGTYGTKPSVPTELYGGKTPGTFDPSLVKEVGPEQQQATSGQFGATATGGTQGTSTGAQGAPSTGVPGATTSPFTVQRAVESGIGPSMFAMQLMSNPKQFKDVMASAGINLTDDQLPTGKTLSENINNISDALKKQYHLDDLLNQKQNMIESGITVERDLTDYIRGRDQYLNQTQGMIDNFQGKMSQMDLSNPANAKQADNYLNYLYTLKGRQNQRYMDFLNSGITQYNRNLTEVSNNYDKALSSYQYELQKKTALTQDEYTMYHTALTEMYNNVEQAPMKKLQMQSLRAQLNAAAASTITDAAGNALAGSPLAKDLGILDGLPVGDAIVDSKTGEITSRVTSIEDVVNDFTAQKGVTPYSVEYKLTNAMKNKLSNTSNTAEAIKSGNDYMKMLSSYYNQARDQQTAQRAAQMAYEVTGAIGNAVTHSLTQNKSDLNNVVNAVGDLTATGFFGGKKKLPSRADFVSKHAAVDSGISNALYQMASDYQTQNSGASTSNIVVLINGNEKKLKDLTPDEMAQFVGKLSASSLYGAFVTPQ